VLHSYLAKTKPRELRANDVEGAVIDVTEYGRPPKQRPSSAGAKTPVA
jgi:hypothetical protein